jgi:hypothetical protein
MMNKKYCNMQYCSTEVVVKGRATKKMKKKKETDESSRVSPRRFVVTDGQLGVEHIYRTCKRYLKSHDWNHVPV